MLFRSILIGVEADVAVSRAKFPFPKPARFLTGAVQEPLEALQPGRYCRGQISKGYDSQRSDPAAGLIVSGDDWPTAIGILRAKQKVLSTFDVANGH